MRIESRKNNVVVGSVTSHPLRARVGRGFLFLTFLSVLRWSAWAHPIPDIPVTGIFRTGGEAQFVVEVNPRCFDPDPTTATSLTKIVFEHLEGAEKTKLLKSAEQLVEKSVELYLEPIGRVHPEFRFEFTGEGKRGFEQDEDVVILTGTWRTRVPAGVTGWNVRSTKENRLSVVFKNEINGQAHPRVAVLFPGERSYTLDLTQLTGAVPTESVVGNVAAVGGQVSNWMSTVWSFCKQGFGHVVPEGLDHILFVLGVFLLGRQWKPLLLQVSAFTLAHSVTLALVTVGRFDLPTKIVQPLIAATIALVAAENLWKPRYTNARLVVVFGFGLIHGMGFASALSDLSIPSGSLLGAIAGFNVGVEGGQIFVILAALVLTGWIRSPEIFRRWVAVPGSILIGLTGIYWTVERLLQ